MSCTTTVTTTVATNKNKHTSIIYYATVYLQPLPQRLLYCWDYITIILHQINYIYEIADDALKAKNMNARWWI